MKHEYRLFKRKNTTIWYFYYYEGKKRINKSTGISKKADAESFVRKFLHLGNKDHDVTLKEYAENFYLWGTCEWIKRQLSKGKRYSITTAKNNRALLINHIFPALGHIEMKNINPVKIENWLLTLPLKGKSKNHILSALRTIFHEALRERLIDYNPISSIEAMAENAKSKTSLTIDEIKLLFPKEERELLRIWGCWFKCAMFYTILTTGLRSGEVRALRWSDISFDENTILIQRAVNADGKVGTTKSGYGRAAFLPNRTALILKRFHDEAPVNNDDLIFPGSQKAGSRSSQMILRYFLKGLENAGINNEIRNLNVHSMRHTYNTLMREVLSKGMLQYQIGHRSDRMTDHYDQATPLEKLNRFNSERKKIDSVF